MCSLVLYIFDKAANLRITDKHAKVTVFLEEPYINQLSAGFKIDDPNSENTCGIFDPLHSPV